MKTVAILGLGPTVRFFRGDPAVEILGVNDITKHYSDSLDGLVLIDPPERFTKERIRMILQTNTSKVYSPHYEWEELLSPHDEYLFNNMSQFHPIRLIPPVNGVVLIDLLDTDDRIVCSFDSTFAACVLAYKQGAERIILYGADFNDHRVLSEKKTLDHILMNYSILEVNLRIRGVQLEVYSSESRLAGILKPLC